MNIRRIKERFPNKQTIRRLRLERYFGHRVNRTTLWAINRTNIARAVAIGLFCSFLPIPFQMIVAAVFALWLRANLPVSVALVWVTNPFTIAFIYTPPYLLGSYLVGEKAIYQERFSSHMVIDHYIALWFGCLIFAMFFSLMGFFLMHGMWRLIVSREWLQRKIRRKKQQKIL